MMIILKELIHMVSERQLQANRENAKKGGVKTEEGKSVIKYNAQKHGLLTRFAPQR